MATLEDLPHKSISDMSTDEAIEHLRQIRLSRRTQKSSPKKEGKRKVVAKATSKAVNQMSPEQAAELLKILGG
jgi:hypothetical protein